MPMMLVKAREVMVEKRMVSEIRVRFRCKKGILKCVGTPMCDDVWLKRGK